MPVINLITNIQADEFNAGSSDWLVLAEAAKTAHIFSASLYMQTYWSCTDIDWQDTDTVTEDQQRACAYYAEADRLALLFPTLEEKTPHGRVVEETNKVGSLLETIKWSGTGSNLSGNPLMSIDALMLIECDSVGGGSSRLTRT